MKIVLPLDENKIDVCVSFARAPYFVFVDTENGQRDIVDNPAASAHGGAGVKAAQLIINNKADAVLTVRCGENAAEAFQAAGIEIYKTAGISIDGNVEAFREGKLEKLTQFHAGFHGVH